MERLSGLFAPLPTPLTDDMLTVSEIRLARIVRWLTQLGIQGLIVGTETGEFTSMSASERKMVLELVLRDSRGAVPVLVHVSSLSTSTSLDLAQHASRHGARGVIVMPPYYGTYAQEELAGHLQAIGNFAKLPVIIVDPKRQLLEEARDKLSEIPAIRFAEPLDTKFEDLSPTGKPLAADCFVLDELVCTPLATIRPKHVLAALAGDKIHASGVNQLFAEYGRGRVIKCALAHLSVEAGPPRAPARNLTGAGFDSLKFALDSFPPL